VSTYYDSETVKELFAWLQDLTHEDHVAIAIRCARNVLHLVPAGELRPLKAIEAAEAWIAKPSAGAARAAAGAAGAARAAAAAAGAAWAAAGAGALAAALAAAAAADDEKAICNLIRSVISERYTETEIAVCMAAKRLQGVGA